MLYAVYITVYCLYYLVNEDRCNRYNQLCPKLVFQQQIVPKVVQQQVVPEVVKQVVPEVVPQQVVTGAVPQQVVNAPVTQEDERQFFPQQYVVVPAVPQHIYVQQPPRKYKFKLFG